MWSDGNLIWKVLSMVRPILGKVLATVKRCLKKTIGKSKHFYDELQTVLLEIVYALNSRSLVTFKYPSLYDDDQEDIVTPNHLLYGQKQNVNSINSDGGGNFNIYRIASNKRRGRSFIS